MKIAQCKLSSISAYSMSKYHETPRLDKEKHDDYDKRTWRMKCHVNADGNVIIPPIAFKFAIDRAAAMLRMRIPGKGQSEYGKHFKAGLLITSEIVVAKSRDDLIGETFFMNANGKKGSGTKVMRTLPQVAKWSGTLEVYVLDEIITQDVFERHLKEAGQLVGVGQFRPENGGYCGRFKVDSVKWIDG